MNTYCSGYFILKSLISFMGPWKAALQSANVFLKFLLWFPYERFTCQNYSDAQRTSLYIQSLNSDRNKYVCREL
jgi:hypothetical protein